MTDRVINESSKRITQKYKSSVHRGVDLGWRQDEEQNKVYANCLGVVYEIKDGQNNNTKATGMKSYGNYVLIKHDNGMFTRYAHLQKGLFVKKGQIVDESTCIGIIGNTGKSYGRHLHFEVATGYSTNTRINPEPYLTKAVCQETNAVRYCVYDNVKNKWLSEITSNSGTGIMAYAGNLGNGISGLKVERLKYRVHDKVKNKWLPYVVGTDDYAGNLPNDIDGVQIYDCSYRVHIKGGKWLDWVSKVDNTSSGYAGIYGKSIDGIQIRVD